MNTKVPKNNIPFAVMVIVFTAMGLSFGDGIVKMTSGTFAIWQVFVLRSIIVVPVLLFYLVFKSRTSLRLPTAFGWLVLRSVILVIMWIVYYMALPHLELSIAAAAYYTAPIFITIFAARLTGDRIAPLGWVAVCIGFLGVLLILRPTAGDFNAYALLPLIAAALYAYAMILTRTKCAETNPVMLAIGLNVAFIIAGGTATIALMLIPDQTEGYLSASWSPMGHSDWLIMGVLAVSILIGSLGAALAYQNGPPSIIGTFDFAYVGFAFLWGLLFFGERPDAISIIGVCFIAIAGYLALRD
jgi:drug/metabolite transporter (DMT)-like permease